MKNLNLIFVLFSFLILQSCETKQTHISPKELPQIEAVKDVDVDINSPVRESDIIGSFKKYRDRNTVEGLFKEYLKSNKDLSDYYDHQLYLIEKYQSDRQKMTEFIKYSEDYYGQARFQGESIQDTVLKNQVKSLINQSENNFKLNNHSKAINESIQLEQQLKDNIIALKLIISEKMIRQIQTNQNPFQTLEENNEKMKNEINQMQQLLGSISEVE